MDLSGSHSQQDDSTGTTEAVFPYIGEEEASISALDDPTREDIFSILDGLPRCGPSELNGYGNSNDELGGHDELVAVVSANSAWPSEPSRPPTGTGAVLTREREQEEQAATGVVGESTPAPSDPFLGPMDLEIDSPFDITNPMHVGAEGGGEGSGMGEGPWGLWGLPLTPMADFAEGSPAGEQQQQRAAEEMFMQSVVQLSVAKAALSIAQNFAQLRQQQPPQPTAALAALPSPTSSKPPRAGPHRPQSASEFKNLVLELTGKKGKAADKKKRKGEPPATKKSSPPESTKSDSPATGSGCSPPLPLKRASSLPSSPPPNRKAEAPLRKQRQLPHPAPEDAKTLRSPATKRRLRPCDNEVRRS